MSFFGKRRAKALKKRNARKTKGKFGSNAPIQSELEEPSLKTSVENIAVSQSIDGPDLKAFGITPPRPWEHFPTLKG